MEKFFQLTHSEMVHAMRAAQMAYERAKESGRDQGRDFPQFAADYVVDNHPQWVTDIGPGDIDGPEPGEEFPVSAGHDLIPADGVLEQWEAQHDIPATNETLVPSFSEVNF